MKEAARGCGGRGLMQIQWWEGGFEVCAGCDVVQGIWDSVGKRSSPGKIMLSGAQWKKTEGEICWEQDREMRSERKRAKECEFERGALRLSGSGGVPQHQLHQLVLVETICSVFSDTLWRKRFAPMARENERPSEIIG